MASRRRAVGVGAVHKNKDIQVSFLTSYLTTRKIKAKFQAKGDQLAGEQLQQFSDQLDVFTKKLEEFAMKHREEIRRNSQFRRYFQEMCMTVGVDPLACKLWIFSIYMQIPIIYSQQRFLDWKARLWQFLLWIGHSNNWRFYFKLYDLCMHSFISSLHVNKSHKWRIDNSGWTAPSPDEITFKNQKRSHNTVF